METFQENRRKPVKSVIVMESVIVSHQGAQIREHKLSGPLVNSHFRVKATTHDLQDHSSTL